MRLRPARRRPLLDLAGLRIESAELAQAGVHVPDDAVLGDVEAPHRCPRERQLDLGERHGRRVDLDQAGAAVAREPGHAVGVDLDAVRLRARGRQRDQLDVAGRRVEAAHHVAVLQGEPHDPLLVEDRRMRVLRGRVRHLVDGGLAGRGIDLADRAVLVARVPGHALGIELHRVRHRARRQRVFLHLAGCRIEPPDQIAELPGPPDGSVGGLDRITRPLAERRHLPLGERDLGAAGDERGRPPGVGREMRREILRDRGLLLGRACHVDHRADQLFPAVARVARAGGDHVGLVAGGADACHQLHAGTGRQPRSLTLLLGLGRDRDQRENRGSHQSSSRGPEHFPPSQQPECESQSTK